MCIPQPLETPSRQSGQTVIAALVLVVLLSAILASLLKVVRQELIKIKSTDFERVSREHENLAKALNQTKPEPTYRCAASTFKTGVALFECNSPSGELTLIKHLPSDQLKGKGDLRIDVLHDTRPIQIPSWGDAMYLAEFCGEDCRGVRVVSAMSDAPDLKVSTQSGYGLLKVSASLNEPTIVIGEKISITQLEIETKSYSVLKSENAKRTESEPQTVYVMALGDLTIGSIEITPATQNILLRPVQIILISLTGNVSLPEPPGCSYFEIIAIERTSWASSCRLWRPVESAAPIGTVYTQALKPS